jgi:V8-like Glu-specific endopeptidase
MRFHEGKFLQIDHNLAAHSCDAFRGQSGSPVIYGGDSQTLFLGLHVGGNEYAGKYFPKNTNKCILFSKEIVNWMNSI